MPPELSEKEEFKRRRAVYERVMVIFPHLEHCGWDRTDDLPNCDTKWRSCSSPISEFRTLTPSDGIEVENLETGTVGTTNGAKSTAIGAQAFVCQYRGYKRCQSDYSHVPGYFHSNQDGTKDQSEIQTPPWWAPKECPDCYLRVCISCWKLMRDFNADIHYFAFHKHLYSRLPDPTMYNEYLLARLQTERRKQLRARGDIGALKADDRELFVEKLQTELGRVKDEKEMLAQEVRELRRQVMEQDCRITKALEALSDAGSTSPSI